MSVKKRTWINAGKRKGRRNGQSWQVYVCHNGERFRELCDSAKEARFVEAKVRGRMMEGTYSPEFYKKTLGDVIDQMLNVMETDYEADFVTSSSYHSFRGITLNYIVGDRERYDVEGKRHINERMVKWSRKKGLAHLKLNKIRRPTVAAFMKEFQYAGASFMQRTSVLGALRKIFDYAMIDLGWIYYNPTTDIEVRRTKAELQGKIEVPQKAHIELFKKVANPLQKLLLQFTCSTALRVGEVLATRWGDIDADSNRISVNATIDRDGKLVPPKTSSGFRRVTMSAQLLTLLEDQWEAAKKANDGADPSDDDFVFLHKGKHFTHSSFYENITRPLFAAAEQYLIDNPDEFPGLPKGISWKDFRHFAISVWLEYGFEDVVVWTMAGHANFESIQRTYGHVFDSPDRLAKFNETFDTLLA